MSDKKCGNGGRFGSTGGQAVLEGVMMKSKDKIALSVRDTKGVPRSRIQNR